MRSARHDGKLRGGDVFQLEYYFHCRRSHVNRSTSTILRLWVHPLDLGVKGRRGSSRGVEVEGVGSEAGPEEGEAQGEVG